MNLYEVKFRQVGHAAPSYQRHVVAESLYAAMERVIKEEIPNDFGSEYKAEFVSVNEVARDVVLPHELNQSKEVNKKL